MPQVPPDGKRGPLADVTRLAGELGAVSYPRRLEWLLFTTFGYS
jgi:hypothetical protein